MSRSLKYPHLADLGFQEDAGELCHEDGTDIPTPQLPYFRRLNGRLDNVAYMAGAIDRYDGVTFPAPSTEAGDTQFEHLIKTCPEQALAYFVLRKLQRHQEIASLKIALHVLIGYEDKKLSRSDLIQYFRRGVEAPEALLRMIKKQAEPAQSMKALEAPSA